MTNHISINAFLSFLFWLAATTPYRYGGQCCLVSITLPFTSVIRPSNVQLCAPLIFCINFAEKQGTPQCGSGCNTIHYANKQQEPEPSQWKCNHKVPVHCETFTQPLLVHASSALFLRYLMMFYQLQKLFSLEIRWSMVRIGNDRGIADMSTSD
jgi:hypothetical protein